ncbi:hypothetical protein SAMN04488595_102127 [Ralstonia sp. 25mfcol4.1]|uniref:hypothetical protein n=1 Tax=Burkholderiaceae TaxID=119060 RepID=UPI0008919FB4|nr:hypothetical protein [Ralstonia sp. 25mfcol4.1]SDO77104.1 hypothetical protein SAMN04488595_102127 [Ralstonia sp. 25mfcol4.1]
MPEYEGLKIVYEVIILPKDKWAIMIEIIRREDGEVLMARHNPFPRQPFDTKLEALDHVNRYVAEAVKNLERDNVKPLRRRA